MRLLIDEALPMSMDTRTYTVPVRKMTEEMFKWIDEHDSDGNVYVGGIALYFDREEDASFFALRWC